MHKCCFDNICAFFMLYKKNELSFFAVERFNPCRCITDSKIAPIMLYATITFVNEQREMSTIDVMPALVFKYINCRNDCTTSRLL